MGTLNSVTVFADCGVTAHQAQYRFVGEALARRNVGLVCTSCGADWPRALVESALGHGGKVTIVVPGRADLRVPRGVALEPAPDAASAQKRAAELGQVLIGLPGGLPSVAALYSAWTAVGGAASGKPVGLLNRRQAFEVVRGFLTDVASVGLGGVDQMVQVSDSFDDLWTRLVRLME